ncbi:MAG: flagellar basal body L-ring protein FlgH [Phycisphaerales bacterium]|nr:flagellar basal body L-ring protein FlgH [Phycisphaerales bacterium]
MSIRSGLVQTTLGRLAIAVTGTLALSLPAGAQSLLQRGPPPAPVREGAPGAPINSPAGTPPATSPTSIPSAPDPGRITVRQVSMYAVTPPPPRQFEKHDLVQVIVNQQSIQKYEQTLDTDKKYDLRAELSKFPSLRHLLEAQLETGDSNPIVEAEVGASNKFKGDGSLERKDRFTTRISGEVLEVKPNGNLVIECKMTSDSNGETTTLLLAGVCRPTDITDANTVQSNQLSDLVIKSHNTGDVKDAAKKGFIPQVLDTIFNF